MTCQILVLPGDGIGPEITPHTLHVLQAADKALGLDLTFETHDIGLKSLRRTGHHPARRHDGTHPRSRWRHPGPGVALRLPARGHRAASTPQRELRTKFELFANIRPCRSREGLTDPA